mmetsp:Transcript_8869/g.28112  ORF Transcript_8869/g.28112 Transcript_8869/m.28112 type:complete len:207 (+) Transcript_8869:358-978(+)
MTSTPPTHDGLQTPLPPLHPRTPRRLMIVAKVVVSYKAREVQGTNAALQSLQVTIRRARTMRTQWRLGRRQPASKNQRNRDHRRNHRRICSRCQHFRLPVQGASRKFASSADFYEKRQGFPARLFLRRPSRRGQERAWMQRHARPALLPSKGVYRVRIDIPGTSHHRLAAMLALLPVERSWVVTTSMRSRKGQRKMQQAKVQSRSG